MHIAEVVTIAKSLPLLRLNTYKSLILSYSADYRRILQEKAGNLRSLVSKLESLRIGHLIVTGEINGEDLSYLTSMVGKLSQMEILDISEVKLVADETPYKVVQRSGSDLHSYTDYYYISDRNYDGNTDIINKVTKYYRNDLESCFSGLVSLKEVDLPDGLPAVGESIFLNCTALKQVGIPTEVEKIGASAFQGCVSLDMPWPSGIKVVGNDAFSGCKALSGVLDLSRVDSLGESAFEDCSSVASVVFSPALKEIGASAFSRCSALEELLFPEGADLKAIGDYAFYVCKGLHAVDLPDGVEIIGKHAFSSSSLSEVSIPSSLLRVGDGAFSGTPWLKALEKESDGLLYIGNLAYKWVGNMEKGMTVSFKEGTVGIADGVFKGKSELASVVFSDCIRYIGAEAFSDCSGLQEAMLPEGLEEIGEKAFYGCKGLALVVIPSTLGYIGSSAFGDCTGLVRLDFNAKYCAGLPEEGGIFLGCTGLEQVRWGSEVSVIPRYMFRGCTGLLSCDLPASLKRIEEGAFYECSGLKSLTIPDGVEYIGSWAFRLCKGLGTLSLGSGVSYIGNSAFDGCSLLEEVDIPRAVRYMGDDAFGYCTNLKTVYYNAVNAEIEGSPFGMSSDKNLASVVFGEDVEYVPAELFFWNSSLSSVSFSNPDKLEYIGQNAFGATDWERNLPTDEVIYFGSVAYAYKSSNGSGNTVRVKEGTTALAGGAFWEEGIADLELPSTLKIIGSNAVNYNYFTSIDIPESVETIMRGAFCRSFNLKSVEWPERVDTIPESAFTLSRSLETVHIPATVKAIEQGAFASCHSLREVYCDVEVPLDIEGLEVFEESGDLSLCKLYVSEGSVDLYKEAAVWKDFDVQARPTVVGTVFDGTEVSVFSSGGRIYVEGLDDVWVDVYQLDGKKVYGGRDASIAVQSGLYVVKVGNGVHKVLVE